MPKPDFSGYCLRCTSVSSYRLRSTEEIVVHGAGLAGSLETRDAEWIDARSADRREDTDALRTRGLGAGESSAIVLAEELRADLLLMDLPEL